MPDAKNPGRTSAQAPAWLYPDYLLPLPGHRISDLGYQSVLQIALYPHFRPDQLRAPSPARIAKALEQLDKDPDCQINVQCLEEDRYRIFWVSPIYADDYVKELDYGYERGYVQYFMEEHT